MIRSVCLYFIYGERASSPVGYSLFVLGRINGLPDNVVVDLFGRLGLCRLGWGYNGGWRRLRSLRCGTYGQTFERPRDAAFVTQFLEQLDAFAVETTRLGVVTLIAT